MLRRNASFERLSREEVDHKDLTAYIKRYKQLNLLQKIENKFGNVYFNQKAQNLILSFGSTLHPAGEGSKSLAHAKRCRPVPGVGYYDGVASSYIKMTQSQAIGLSSLSLDKLPRLKKDR